MFRDYFVWWARQMLDILPPSLKDFVRSPVDALLIDPEFDPSFVAVTLRRGDRLFSLGRFKSDAAGLAAANAVARTTRPAEIWLCLRPGVMIEKQLALPLAAENELRRVLAYEMDRETPFTADEVWWSWRLIERDRQRAQLKLTLFLAPKTAVRELIDALARAGLTPHKIDAASRSGSHIQIGLDPKRIGKRDRPQGLAPLTAACLSLALIAFILPFARQSLALSQVESRIAVLQPQVDAVQKLRLRIGGQTVAAASAGPAPSIQILRVLAKTTDILPDDTYLTDLTLHQRKLGLTGQSTAAAKLIGRIAADPFFKDPAFSAAVTRVQGAKLDAFSINAEIRP